MHGAQISSANHGDAHYASLPLNESRPRVLFAVTIHPVPRLDPPAPSRSVALHHIHIRRAQPRRRQCPPDHPMLRRPVRRRQAVGGPVLVHPAARCGPACILPGGRIWTLATDVTKAAARLRSARAILRESGQGNPDKVAGGARISRPPRAGLRAGLGVCRFPRHLLDTPSPRLETSVSYLRRLRVPSAAPLVSRRKRLTRHEEKGEEMPCPPPGN